MKSTVDRAGSQFSAMRATERRNAGGRSFSTGFSVEIGEVFTGGRNQEEAQARPCGFSIKGFQDGQWVGQIGATPTGAGLGHFEVASRRGAVALDAYAGFRNIEEFTSLVLGENAGDVVVDHDDLVHQPKPLPGEHADGGGTTSDPHAFLGLSVDDRRLPRGDDDARAAVHRNFHRLAVTQGKQAFAGDAAFLLRSAGQVPHAAERQHLRAVLSRRDMPDLLAIDADRRALGAEMAVGVDLHLHAAVAEDALGDDGDHVDAVDLGGHDEGCRLVIWIGRACPDGGDEGARPSDDVAVPVLAAVEEGHQPSALFLRALDQDVGIDTHQPALLIGIAVAGAAQTFADVAEHRAGVAADLVLLRVGHGCSIALMAALMRSGVAGVRVMRAPVA
jgi:hypothetical protein